MGTVRGAQEGIRHRYLKHEWRHFYCLPISTHTGYTKLTIFPSLWYKRLLFMAFPSKHLKEYGQNVYWMLT